ncbi:MAG: aminoglycoside phosphotransferase, partial [Myxococcota bacterium]|nr:aminoglycoside phosphotransferase [Myxococcota bacterium]
VEDINALLGASFSEGEAAAAALEEWVAEADPGADADLLRLFYRRCMRQECLLEPVLGEFTGARIQMLD